MHVIADKDVAFEATGDDGICVDADVRSDRDPCGIEEQHGAMNLDVIANGLHAERDELLALVIVHCERSIEL